MKKTKRKKLEKAGWKVGTAEEFLGIPKKRKGKKKCQAETPICSNELVRTYGVNGSEKNGETFDICGPCAVMLRKQARLKEV